MAAGQVGNGPYGTFNGSLPDSFGFRQSQLNPAGSAVPVTGTNAYGAPGIRMPQTSNIQASGTSNPAAIAAGQVNSGPFGQPAFLAFVSMVVGVFFLAVVAHVEAR